MLAEWTTFTQVSGVQRCPRSSRQVAADDLRPVHAIVVAGRAPARASARAAPLPLLRVLLLHLLPVPLRRRRGVVARRVLRRRRAHGGLGICKIVQNSLTNFESAEGATLSVF